MEAKHNILITGASGLLGHTLCSYFSKNHHVTGLRRSHPIGLDHVTDIEIDLLDRNEVVEATGAAGYNVLQASDGEEALEIVNASTPDLLILDVMIPKRDGYDVCQTIRANPSFKDIRIIMATAKGQEVEVEKGLALGADAYLTKPFSTKELVAKVKSLLGDDGE